MMGPERNLLAGILSKNKIEKCTVSPRGHCLGALPSGCFVASREALGLARLSDEYTRDAYYTALFLGGADTGCCAAEIGCAPAPDFSSNVRFTKALRG